MVIPHSIPTMANISDSVLCDFVMTQADAACIKNKNGALILGNEAVVKIFAPKIGSNCEKLQGLTVYDLSKIMHPYWKDRYAKKWTKIDYQVKTFCRTIIEKEDILIDGLNQIRVHDVFKLPLVGINNKVTSILTITTDRTKELDIFYLLNLYITVHKDPRSGLRYFIQYLGLTDFFCGDLTLREIQCLLYMRVNQSYKNVAKEFNISVKTVEVHISHIISKLKHPYFQLSNILSYLRLRKLRKVV